MSDKHLGSSDSFKWMDPRFITIDRERYMQIYNKIQHIQGPSLRITTKEMADVVGGERDRTLPRWASDVSCLGQLSKLIKQNQYVWVCSKCDSIISFYDDPDEAFVMAACKVYSEHPIPCPYCQSELFMLCDSMALLKGEPLAVPNISPVERHPAASGAPVANAYEGFCRPSQQNAEYLEDLLNRINYISPYERAFELNLVGHAIDLAPQFSKLGVDDLGIAWDGVQRTIASKFSKFLDVAVGMSKTIGFSASCYTGSEGQMAIIVELGLLWGLQYLNRLVNCLHGEGHEHWQWEDILENVISILITNKVRPKNYIRPLELDRYDGTPEKAERERLKARIVTMKQLRFLLLHEVGHLVLGLTHTPLCRDEHESSVDEWAVKLILAGGDEDDEPWNDKTWVQWKGTFWMFEFWHIIEACDSKGLLTQSTARSRWDNIELSLTRAGASVPDAKTSRGIVDDTLTEMLMR